MFDETPFIAAIVANPTDDLPRLMLADALDEAGNAPRAEFIRAQLALARGGDTQLALRERELLQRHADAWQIPHIQGKQFFRRGVVEALWTTAERLLAQPSALNAAPQLRELRVVNANDTRTVERLAALPVLAQLDTLDLRNNSFGIDRRIRRFFRAAQLPKLRRLSLYMNTLDSDDLMDLIDCDVTAQLIDLDVSANAFGQPGMEVLASARRLVGLRTLTARADEMAHYDCLHEQAGQTLAASKTLRLHSLDLADHYLGDAGLTSLLSSPNSAELSHLGLAYNEVGLLGESGIASLTRSTHLTALRELNLAGNVLGNKAVELVLSWPQLSAMHWIDLREATIDAGALPLLREHAYAHKFLLT